MEELDFEEVKGNLINWKKYRQLPQTIMERKYDAHNRDWYRYMQSIEWDTYPSFSMEQREELRLEEERKRHPFNKWI